MKRFNPYPILATALLAVAVGCAKQNEAESEEGFSARTQSPASSIGEILAPEQSAAEAPAVEDAANSTAVQKPGVDAQQIMSSTNTVADTRRRFVRAASAQFQVKDVYASTLAIEDAVAAEGGFVVKNTVAAQVLDQREKSIGDGQLLVLSRVATQGSLVVRVPSERTQSFLRTVAKQMQFLDARAFEASDVQFDLLRKQLAFQRAQELQRDIAAAAAQPAKTGDKVDAVQAREQMLAARDEATVAERELEDRIAFSTLTLELQQPATVREQTVPDTEALLRERGPGFFSEIRAAIGSGWRGLLVAVVALVHLWPLWLVLAAGAWAVVTLRRWRRRRRAAAPGTSEPATRA